MRSNSLPNLRGLVTNGAQLKIAMIRAANQVIMYAKRGPGYSPGALALQETLQAAIDAIRSYTRAASISVSPATDTLAAEETQQLTVTATYEDAETEDVTEDTRCVYTTSDDEVATVDTAGLVTAVATGEATITATYHGRTDTCVVTVS